MGGGGGGLRGMPHAGGLDTCSPRPNMWAGGHVVSRLTVGRLPATYPEHREGFFPGRNDNIHNEQDC